MRAFVGLCLMASVGWAAAPPARLTPEQLKLLRERNARWSAGLQAWKEGRRDEAVTALERVLEGELRFVGPWHPSVELMADRLGDWHQARGGWEKEAACRRLVVEARWRLHGEGHWRAVDAGLKVREAEAQPKRTADQRDALRRGWALNDQALSLSAGGEAGKALPLAKEVVAIRKEALGERHPDYATSLNNLAFLHSAMGDHKAALPLYERALVIRKEALGERHPLYATSLNNLAFLHSAMGDHKAALPLYERAVTVWKEALGERHPLYATSLNNLALLYSDMGDHKAALRLYERALAITRDMLGERHPDYARSLNNLATLRSAMGDHRAALPLYERTVAITKEALGERHPDYATSLNNLATLHVELGDHQAALALHQRALAIRNEVLGEQHPDYAQSLNNLATLHFALGNHKKALPLSDRAMAVHKEAQGERHRDYASALINLATLHLALGNHKKALPLSDRAMAITLAKLRDAATVQSDRQQLAASDSLRWHLNVRLSIRDGEGDASAYGHVLAWKGAVLLRQRQHRLFVRLEADPETRAASERLQAATRALAALKLSPSATRSRMEALETEQERAQAELSRLSADFRTSVGEKPTPEALAKSLPDGTALIDFLYFTRGGLEDKDGKPRSERHLVAFVSRKGQPAARLDLGPADPVEDAVAKWRSDLLAARPAESEHGRTLRKLVWEPLAKHVAGAKLLLVSPDGVLGTVPFAALPGKDAGTFLIEEAAVAVVPVPQLLLAPAPKAERLKPSLLVAGDLRYDPGETPARRAGVGDRSAARAGGVKYRRLEATRAEVMAVRASFDELFGSDQTKIDLRDGRATKPAVREALASVRYAHLATHGYFAPEEVKSALDAKGKDGPAREVIGWHPLLLSGLALSDANRDPKPGEEDGILSALEVSEMDLTRLELAVLSACETGLGKAAAGEGLLGMQRAFAAAGARTVVASLWKVDDKATRQLMTDFYAAAWDPKDDAITRAEALRKAQLAMLRGGLRRGSEDELPPVKSPPAKPAAKRTPPYYWAAFVLSGDWR